MQFTDCRVRRSSPIGGLQSVCWTGCGSSGSTLERKLSWGGGGGNARARAPRLKERKRTRQLSDSLKFLKAVRLRSTYTDFHGAWGEKCIKSKVVGKHLLEDRQFAVPVTILSKPATILLRVLCLSEFLSFLPFDGNFLEANSFFFLFFFFLRTMSERTRRRNFIRVILSSFFSCNEIILFAFEIGTRWNESFIYRGMILFYYNVWNESVIILFYR